MTPRDCIALAAEAHAALTCTPVNRVRLILADRHLDLSFDSEELSDLLTRAVDLLRSDSDIGSGPDAPRPSARFAVGLNPEIIESLAQSFEWPRSDRDSQIVMLHEHHRLAIQCAEDGPVGLHWYDAERHAGVYLARSMRAVTELEQPRPLLRLFAWWAEQHGMLVAHAAAVGTERGCVLFAGPGGTGKSTAALAAVGQALRYLGDDCIVIDPAARAHALFRTARVWPEMRDRLRRLQPQDSFEWQSYLGKPTTWVDPAYVTRSAPIKAVIVPRLSDRSAVMPCSRSEALRTLVPTTLAAMSTNAQGAFGLLARVIAEVPAYTLEVCDDLEGTRASLNALLETLNGSGS